MECCHWQHSASSSISMGSPGVIKQITLVVALLCSTSSWAEQIDRFIPLSHFLEEGGQLELRDAWDKGFTKSLSSHNHLFKEFLPARILLDTHGNVTLNFSFFPQNDLSTSFEGASRYGSVRKLFKRNDQPMKANGIAGNFGTPKMFTTCCSLRLKRA